MKLINPKYVKLEDLNVGDIIKINFNSGFDIIERVDLKKGKVFLKNNQMWQRPNKEKNYVKYENNC